MDELHRKYEALLDGLRALGSAAVAFSGGVDSTFLLRAAREALGERAVAVTARICAVPERELRAAEALCAVLGAEQIFVDVDVLRVAGFRENPPDRCYHCKREIFGAILRAARERGLNAVAEGSNLDDEGDYRPGMVAIRELGVRSPLREVGLNKEEIRALSRELRLPTWDKPSMACLASRFAYGEAITAQKLEMVDRAEQRLRELGLRQLRVRVHGDVARIELSPEDFPRLLADGAREDVDDYFKSLGFHYVTLDLRGFRTGSMNEALRDSTRATNKA